MFSRKYRLPAKVQLKNSSVIHSPFFVLKIAKNTVEYNRYGFIVSKKIDKRATVRNRIKRRIRAYIEQINEKIESGNDFLFIIKKEAIDKKTEEIYITIDGIFSKGKLFLKQENF